MFLSEHFGRAFWIDDNSNDFTSCPLKVNNEPDFDYIDYVSEWEVWEGVNFEKLFYIHHLEIINKERFGNKLTNSGQLLNSLLLSTQNALPKCSLRYIIILLF